MAFPNVIYMPDGEQFNQYTDQRYELGTQMILQDGRKFRFAKAGATLLVAGTLQQAAANVANNVNMAVSATTAVGATSIPVTLGGGTIAANQYKDGYIHIDVTPGMGYSYKIAAHGAVGSGTAWTVPLAPGNSVQVALSTSSKASVTKNPYDSVIINPTTPSGVPVGIAMSATALSTWGWMQTAGECNVLTNGTVVLGGPVVASVTTAGAVEAFPAGAAETATLIGVVQRVGATTAQSVILLRQLDS